MTSKVSPGCQIVVPKPIRQRFNIRIGTVLDWILEGDTLRVVKADTNKPVPGKLTTLRPWPRGALARAYKRADKSWERVEAAATHAQRTPSWED